MRKMIKNKMLCALVLLVLLIFSSCSATDPVLRTNSDLQSEVEEMGKKGGSVITPASSNSDCLNGHTGVVYAAGEHGCIKVCNRCGEVLGEEIPHTPERSARGYVVIGNVSYEQIYLICKKCRVPYEKEYTPFDVRNRK